MRKKASIRKVQLTQFPPQLPKNTKQYKEMVEYLKKFKPANYKAPSADSKFIGSWSNGESGFKTLQLRLASEGIGFVGASVVTMPLLWSATNHVATLIIPETETRTSEMRLEYDDALDQVLATTAEDNRPLPLYRAGGWSDYISDTNVTVISKGSVSYFVFGKELVNLSSVFIDFWGFVESADIEGIRSVAHPSYMERNRRKLDNDKMTASAEFARAYNRIEIRLSSSDENTTTLRVTIISTSDPNKRNDLQVVIVKSDGKWLIKDIDD